ncbi:MAG: DMT family transporter [Halothiobacillaceae bacterium]|nr:DMT family transporter [Halothiobacillaceae bacterium]
MSAAWAYWGVILIWSTTPLAIDWSVEPGVDWLFALALRMWGGLVIAFVFLAVLRERFPLDRRAWHAYVAAALGVYLSMLLTYWAAQHLSSGVLAVVFGLTPFFTSLLAGVGLGERLTWNKILGMLLGFGGLWLFFHDQLTLGDWGWIAVMVMALSTFLHALSTVWVKRVGAQVSGLAVTAGALLLSAPLYALSWVILGVEWPQTLAPRTLGAIAYLAVVGSVLGFFLYFHALRVLPASRMGLIPLLTPLLAVSLAMILNDEHFTPMAWAGFASVMAGLLLHESAALRRWGVSRMKGRSI